MHRRHVRRRASHRRRRHNPSPFRGLPIPDFMEVGAGIAGGVGSKYLSNWLLKDMIAKDTSGFVSPAGTFGGAIALGFILNMLKMGRFAKAVVMGGAIVAGIDVVHKVAPQLGYYTAPGDMVPVFSGVGNYPPGFMDPSLSAGNLNDPTGFELNPY